MGACHSESATDPVETAAGAPPPVYWSPEKEQEKRAAKLKELRIRQEEEIERATGHLRKPSAHDHRRRSSTGLSLNSMASSVQSHAASAADVKAVEEEKTAADGGVVISSPRPVPHLTISAAHAQQPSSNPLSPASTPSSPLRHNRSANSQVSGQVHSTSATPSSAARRTSAPSTPGRAARKADWDYEGLPGARPTSSPPDGAEAETKAEVKTEPTTTAPVLGSTSTVSRVQRHVRAPTMEAVREPVGEEKEQEQPKTQAESAVSKLTPDDASAVFGVKLRRVQRDVAAPPAPPSPAAAVAS